MDIKKYLTKRSLEMVLSVWIAFVFLQSLPYKFTNHPETQHIFGTIGTWMGTNVLSFMSNFFIHYGGYAVGIFELITVILLFKTSTKAIAPFFSLSVMSGAIFFHLFTPLGVDIGDGGSLFTAAVLVWISSLVLIYLRKDSIKTYFSKS